MDATKRLQALDRRQQRSPRVAFVAAVIKKFADDRGGQLAALIAYYSFVALFPLLLVLVTVLGFVLQGDPAEQQRILNGTLGQFPLISDQLKLHSLTGSALGVAVGLVVSLLAGLGLTSASQQAFDRMWSVPVKDRRDFLSTRLRGLGTIVALGTLWAVSTSSAGFVGFVGSSSHGIAAVLAGVAVAFVVNLALFMIAFKALPSVELSWRELLPGVVLAVGKDRPFKSHAGRRNKDSKSAQLHSSAR